MAVKLLVDGNNLAFRVHFVHPYLRSGSIFTGVIYGTLTTLLKVKSEYKDSRIIFCWDSRENPRKKICPTYKGNRTTHTPDRKKIFEQTPLLRIVLDKLGVYNAQCDGFEADDIIAILSKRYEKKTGILSNDSDLYQLLTDNCHMLDSKSMTNFTKKDFCEQYEITPDRWSMILAIAGKSSNNLPGVKGVGLRTAIQFLQGKQLKRKNAEELISTALHDGTVHKNLMLTKLPFDENVTPKLTRPSKNKEQFRKLCMQYKLKEVIRNFHTWERLFF